MGRNLLFILEKLVSVMDENRIEMLARQHSIRQKRDDGGLGKTLTAFIRRAEEGTRAARGHLDQSDKNLLRAVSGRVRDADRGCDAL
jgi:hypothetical protein